MPNDPLPTESNGLLIPAYLYVYDAFNRLTELRDLRPAPIAEFEFDDDGPDFPPSPEGPFGDGEADDPFILGE